MTDGGLDLRRSPLGGETVLIVPGRAGRPGALGRTTRIADASTCPFCEGHESLTPPEVEALGRATGAPDSPGWTVRVVPNKFPAFPGHEVVVHGPAHALTVADVDPDIWAVVLQAWEHRRAAHEASGAACVLLVVNEGPAAGASLDHSHSQVVPFTDVPPVVAREQTAFAAVDRCPLCELESTAIDERDGLVTFAPRWSRVPYETWIAPRTHEPRSPLDAAVARALQGAVTRLRNLLGDELAWNAVLHERPAQADGPFHWHIELLPRLTVQASIEIGAGIWVNVVDPARAAGELSGVG
jgi:UDPglucose--hexose-1-phosphate uridylyltransferase